MSAAVPYIEPHVVSVLILSSFLLPSNIANFFLDHAVYCGLLGQILVGVAWGTPGANLLEPEIESTIIKLGYLGLILLVFEGTHAQRSYLKIYGSFLNESQVAFQSLSKR